MEGVDGGHFEGTIRTFALDDKSEVYHVSITHYFYYNRYIIIIKEQHVSA